MDHWPVPQGSSQEYGLTPVHLPIGGQALTKEWQQETGMDTPATVVSHSSKSGINQGFDQSNQWRGL